MAEGRIYLTTGPLPSRPDEVLAIVTIGTPQKGDKDVQVLTLETFPKGTPHADIQSWFERMMAEQPWNSRQ